jgi:hypothetical protein
MLEWKPRFIALILFVVLVAMIAGVADFSDSLPMNWEW